MGYGSKESTKETRQKAERLLSILQKTFKGREEMKKLITILTITLLLSSCALLDKLRGGVNTHSDVLIEVPVVTEDIRG